MLPRSAFRLVVAAAYAGHRRGDPAQLPGIPCDPPVRVDVDPAVGDAVIGGGIYRCRLHQRVWQLFTTTLDRLETARALTDGAPVVYGTEAERPTGFVNVRWQHDAETGITVVHAHSGPSDDHIEPVTQTLQTLLGRCSTHELLSSLDS
jgi:hypothetical protein